jgi:hypothetical protein
MNPTLDGVKSAVLQAAALAICHAPIRQWATWVVRSLETNYRIGGHHDVCTDTTVLQYFTHICGNCCTGVSRRGASPVGNSAGAGAQCLLNRHVEGCPALSKRRILHY